MANGTHCVVYLENGRTVSSATIDNLVAEFDGKIWNTVTTNFASPTDTDGNGKIVLLLLDIKDGYDGVNNLLYVGGYFFSVDLFAQADLVGLGWPAHYKSNESEILYIDVNPNDPTTTSFKSTVSHEFQHLVNTSRNVISENGDAMPTWIDEGFAMAAEAIYQDVDLLSSRENWYNNDPLYTGAGGVAILEGASLLYGYPLAVWDPYSNVSSIAVLNNYALSHLFFGWLRIHMNSDAFFKTIMDSNDNTLQAVVDVCSATLGADIDTTPKIITRFYMANLLGGNGKITGIESYLGKNTHTGPFYFNGAGNQAINILPGGAFHFINVAYNNWTPAGGDPKIVYALGNIVLDSADYLAPYGTGNINAELMIVLNGASIGNGTAVTAVLPNIMQNFNIFSADGDKPQKINSSRHIIPKKLPKEAFKKGLERGTVNLPLPEFK